MEDNPIRRKRSKTKKAKRLSQTMLARIKPNAAGIDCGSAHHHVAVPPDRDAEPVRRFKTLTPDLYRLADWLAACGIETVAMEATGVYWIPIYEILEERWFGGCSCERPSREERPGAQDRRRRLPVDPSAP